MRKPLKLMLGIVGACALGLVVVASVSIIERNHRERVREEQVARRLICNALVDLHDTAVKGYEQELSGCEALSKEKLRDLATQMVSKGIAARNQEYKEEEKMRVLEEKQSLQCQQIYEKAERLRTEVGDTARLNYQEKILPHAPIGCDIDTGSYSDPFFSTTGGLGSEILSHIHEDFVTLGVERP